jgi:hypothetical protein
MPKKKGGMGFQNYEDFNQALLAKQAWRMVTAPNSLCARVLRARYFENGDFLSAACPKKASYTWRSILHGRELLKEGLIWRVGNGSNINVWSQNWMPRSTLQKPFGHRPDVEVTKVQELLLPDGAGWNVNKLSECFFESDVADILKIPVGRAGSEDYLAWNYTKNGEFSVQSAYHLKRQLRLSQEGRPGPSTSFDDHQGWLALWAADVPGKVKIHCWRLLRNGLAVGEELRRREIKDGVVCIACARPETLFHRFWECPFSSQVWSYIREGTCLSIPCPPNEFRSHAELQGWFLDWWGSYRRRN